MGVYKLLNRVTTVGASRAIRLSSFAGVKDHAVNVTFEPTGVAAITALTISLQGSHTNKDAETGVITSAGLVAASSGGNANKYIAIGSTFTYLIANTNYTVAAATAGQAFSAAHVIGNGVDDFYGVVNIYIDSTGTLQTLVLLETQLYTSSALAVAAVKDWKAGPDYPPGFCPIGRLIIRCTAKTWTANSSNITASSGVTSIQFDSFMTSFQDLSTAYSFTAIDILNRGAMLIFKGYPVGFARLWLSVLTGNAMVSAAYLPKDSP
jgi:hypothetical protein